MTPTPARAKTLRRLGNLLARAKSQNVHEAALAQTRADELIAKHAITPQEIADLLRANAPKVVTQAGLAPSPWHVDLALAVAKARDGKALKRKNKDNVAFEGPQADDAAKLYRATVATLEEQSTWHFAACGYVHMPAFKPIWDTIFCSEAALALLEPASESIPGDTHGIPRTEVERALGCTHIDSNIRYGVLGIFFQNANNSGRRFGASMDLSPKIEPVERPGVVDNRPTFALRQGLVLVSARQGGNHANLFHNGKSLPFRRDLSVWDDANKDYTWTFETGGTLVEGDKIVFATGDRHKVGQVVGGELVEVDAPVDILRNSVTLEPLQVRVKASVLVLVLSCDRPPYSALRRAQEATWDAVSVPGVDTRYYHCDNLDVMPERLKEELRHVNGHDYVFRTNSSSYVDKRALLIMADVTPRIGIYAGVDGGGFASGSGFLLSRDVVTRLVEKLPDRSDAIEDVAVGRALGLPVHGLPRVDYWLERELANITGAPFEDRVRAAHHVRCKHAADRTKDVEALKAVHAIKIG